MLRVLARQIRQQLPHQVRHQIHRVGRFFAPFPPTSMESVEFPSLEGALLCLHHRGYRPRFAIDVGAYHGEWTQMFLKYFPESSVFMVEAQEQKRATLEAVRAQHEAAVDFRIALLGATSGQKVHFVEMETGSSVFEENSRYDRQKLEKSTTSLDDLLESDSRSVDFIKLDVQGYELEVLRGASRCLTQAEVVLMEASLVPINEGAPLIADVIRFMADSEFRLVDFCSQIRRKDGVLWQTDLLFVRTSSKFLPDNQLTVANWF